MRAEEQHPHQEPRADGMLWIWEGEELLLRGTHDQAGPLLLGPQTETSLNKNR